MNWHTMKPYFLSLFDTALYLARKSPSAAMFTAGKRNKPKQEVQVPWQDWLNGLRTLKFIGCYIYKGGTLKIWDLLQMPVHGTLTDRDFW